MLIKEKNIYNFFLLFLLCHVFIWTLVPSLSNNNLPLDTIEALAWGSDLKFGYTTFSVKYLLSQPFLLYLNFLKIFLKKKFTVFFQYYY